MYLFCTPSASDLHGVKQSANPSTNFGLREKHIKQSDKSAATEKNDTLNIEEFTA